MFRLLLMITTLLFQTNDNRVLAVYTTDINNAYYKQQMKILNNDKAGLADRDIIIKTHVYGSQTAAVFQKHKIKGAFAVTLTGKDGGEKYRGIQPVTLQQLYGTVDAMPMRKQEMKH